MTLDEALLAAVQHHQAGRLAEAEQIYRLILQHQPDHPEALHRLGLLAHQAGRQDIAVDLLQRAARIAPTHMIWNTLGEVLRRAGRAAESIGCYREALRLSPASAVIRVNLALALKATQKPDEAAAELRRAIADQPGDAQAHLALGNIHREQGRAGEAIACYSRAIEAGARTAEAHSNLAVLLEEQKQYEPAEMHARRAVELQPERAEFHYNLGNVCLATGKWEPAAGAYQAALAIDARSAPVHGNFGTVLMQLGRHDEAMEHLRMAVALQPRTPEYIHSVGSAHQTLGQLTEAIDCYRQALAVNPDMAEAHNSLGTALESQGKLTEAIACFRRAVELSPGDAAVRDNLGGAMMNFGAVDEGLRLNREAASSSAAIHSNLLLAMHYTPASAPQAIFEEHRAWAKRHAAPFYPQVMMHARGRDPARRLRIGYVSPDFREHSVGYFAESILAHADHRQFEVFCYFGAGREDATTPRFRRCADAWRPIARMDDREAAELIKADGIDILVDLSGHTAGNRMLVFARKPAPIQVTYLGYPDTTGLATMDYRITDARCDPPGQTEALHTETLVRLPGCFLCYRPPEDCPPVATLPALARKQITFGSFNAFLKISGEMLDMWGRLLLDVPGSRLLIKSKSLADAAVREQVHSRFARLGVDPARLELLPRTKTVHEHLSVYGRVDIALDTFPYCGTTTTCEALWMGVPVVSLAGQTHVSRVGLSLLAAAGLGELAAGSAEEYVRAAANLARDIDRLAALRRTMRDRLHASPLLDASGLAANIESAYRRMWQT